MTEKSKEIKKEPIQEATFTEELTAVLEEIKEEPVKEKKKGETVTVINETEVHIGERQYRLVKNHREAFDPERLGERFSDVLSRYDYIVGDWGYDQLRLKGFFYVTNRKATPDQRIDTLEDYLYEFCNFGCAYFVLEQTGERKEKTPAKRKRSRKPQNRQQAFVEEKKGAVNKGNKPVIRQRKTTESKRPVNKKKPVNEQSASPRSFTIRQREE